MNKRIARIGAAVGVATITAVLGACAPDAQAGTPNGDGPISFQWGAATGSYLAQYVALERGYFEEEGLNPSFQTFTSGAPMLAAFQSESLDIGTVGLATVFALGQGIDLRIFSLEGDASAAEGIVARERSSITQLADLANGRPIGIPTGTCAQISAYYASQAIGVDYSELNAVDIVPNLYANAFESASIDAGFSWSPYLVDLAADGGEIIGYDADWVPGGGSCPETNFGRTSFIEKHPEVPERIVRALDRAWADIRENPDVAVQALMKKLSIDEATAQATAERYIAAQPTLEQMLDENDRYAFVGTEGMVAQFAVASDAFAALGVIEAPLTTEQLDTAIDDTAIRAGVDAQE